MNTAERLRGLYAITDQQLLSDEHFIESVEYALQGGATIIQYRDKSNDTKKRLKQASQLKNCCQKYQALLIINDDIDLCRVTDADGVHLGRHDGDILHARQQLGADAIIGASCYNDLQLARQAEKAGASYVAFGAMYASATKPDAVIAGADILTLAQAQLDIPVCAIGGITVGNGGSTIAAGADMLAVISSLFAVNDIQHRARQFSALFRKRAPSSEPVNEPVA